MVETPPLIPKQAWNGSVIVGHVVVALIGEKTVVTKRGDTRMRQRSRIAWVVLTKIVVDGRGMQRMKTVLVVITFHT